MSGRVELINADIVMARLLGMPSKIRETVERKALVEANKLAIGRLRENTPTETGALKKSFKYDIRKWKGGNVLAGIVGADNDYVSTDGRNKKRRRPAKYLHLVDLGTKNKVEARKFREKTAREIAPQVQQILENAVHEALK